MRSLICAPSVRLSVARPRRAVVGQRSRARTGHRDRIPLISEAPQEFGPHLVVVTASAVSREVGAEAERESSRIAAGKSQQVALIDVGDLS
jgi:hypothetical protein